MSLVTSILCFMGSELYRSTLNLGHAQTDWKWFACTTTTQQRIVNSKSVQWPPEHTRDMKPTQDRQATSRQRSISLVAMIKSLLRVTCDGADE